MQPFTKTATLQESAGKLINNHHLTITDNILLIFLIQRFGFYGCFKMVNILNSFVCIKIIYPQRFFRFFNTGISHHGCITLFIQFKVFTLFKLRCDICKSSVQLLRFFCRSRNDKRCPRLVNENRVNLVNDGKGVPALADIFRVISKMVSKIIKTKLVIRTVSNVSIVCLRAVALFYERLNNFVVSFLITLFIIFFEVGILFGGIPVGVLAVYNTNRKPKEIINLPHPDSVTPSQVIVYSYDMHRVTIKCIQVDRRSGSQRLTLTGLHLGDGSFVHHNPAHQLNVVVPLTQRTLSHLTDNRESFI